MKFINQQLQSCYDQQDWSGLMKEADKIAFCGSKLPAISAGGVKVFPNGKLSITEDEVFRAVDTLTFGGEVNGHRKVVANKARRALYPAEFLLVEAQS